MDLKFIPSRVKELEDKLKKPFTVVMDDFSITSVTLLVMTGLQVDEEEALKAIEAYLNEDESHDLMSLYVLIVEKLQKAGFLPRALNLEDLKAKLQDPEALRQLIENATR